jgi:hypothetical protein
MQLINDVALLDSRLKKAGCPCDEGMFEHLFRGFAANPISERIKLWQFKKGMRQRLLDDVLWQSAPSASSGQTAAASPPVIKQETERKRKFEHWRGRRGRHQARTPPGGGARRRGRRGRHQARTPHGGGARRLGRRGRQRPPTGGGARQAGPGRGGRRAKDVWSPGSQSSWSPPPPRRHSRVRSGSPSISSGTTNSDEERLWADASADPALLRQLLEAHKTESAAARFGENLARIDEVKREHLQRRAEAARGGGPSAAAALERLDKDKDRHFRRQARAARSADGDGVVGGPSTAAAIGGGGDGVGGGSALRTAPDEAAAGGLGGGADGGGWQCGRPQTLPASPCPVSARPPLTAPDGSLRHGCQNMPEKRGFTLREILSQFVVTRGWRRRAPLGGGRCRSPIRGGGSGLAGGRMASEKIE